MERHHKSVDLNPWKAYDIMVLVCCGWLSLSHFPALRSLQLGTTFLQLFLGEKVVFGMYCIAVQCAKHYNLLQLFYNFCRGKHGKGRNRMKQVNLKKPSIHAGFSVGRSKTKRSKMRFLQIPTMKPID